MLFFGTLVLKLDIESSHMKLINRFQACLTTLEKNGKEKPVKTLALFNLQAKCKICSWRQGGVGGGGSGGPTSPVPPLPPWGRRDWRGLY